MTQFEHNLIATILLLITHKLVYYFFPIPEEKAYCNNYLKDKFGF